MKNLKVTVFQKMISGRSIAYVPKVFNCARYSVKYSANSNVSAKGFIPNSEIILRIHSAEADTIKNGDRVILGEASALNEKALTVRAVHINRAGSKRIRHTKVVCA